MFLIYTSFHIYMIYVPSMCKQKAMMVNTGTILDRDAMFSAKKLKPSNQSLCALSWEGGILILTTATHT